MQVTLYKSLCAGHSVQVTLYKSLCTSHSVQVTLYKSLCTSHSVQVTLYRSLCTSHFIQVTLYKSLCAGHSVQVTLYKSLCTSHSVQFTLCRSMGSVLVSFRMWRKGVGLVWNYVEQQGWIQELERHVLCARAHPNSPIYILVFVIGYALFSQIYDFALNFAIYILVDPVSLKSHAPHPHWIHPCGTVESYGKTALRNLELCKSGMLTCCSEVFTAAACCCCLI